MFVRSGKVRVMSPRFAGCFKWTIENFTLDNPFESPIFSTRILDQEFRWELKLFPRGENEETQGYLSIVLYNRSNAIFNGSLRFIVCHGQNGRDAISFESDDNEIAKDGYLGCHRFVNSLELNNFLNSKQELLILCEIRYNDEVMQKKRSEEKKELQKLKEFYEQKHNLFPEMTLSDVLFIVEDKDSRPFKLHLHKCIMANASSVFDDMFKEKLQQCTEEIEIKDVKYDVFWELVAYAYNKKLPECFDKDLFEGLKVAAMKYEMQELVGLCEKRMSQEEEEDNENPMEVVTDMPEFTELSTSSLFFFRSSNDQNF